MFIYLEMAKAHRPTAQGPAASHGAEGLAGYENPLV
jgi:hypothetical protein